MTPTRPRRPRARSSAWAGLILLVAGCTTSTDQTGDLGGAGSNCDADPVACGGCVSDAGCFGAKPRCDLRSSRCVACLPGDDNCMSNESCVDTHDGYACVPDCHADADCAKSDLGLGPTCCGGRCVDTNVDTLNCSACGKPCPKPDNGFPGCVSGVCGIGSCAPGFGNCDGVTANGCEIDTSANLTNCGKCGTVCVAPNGTPGCAGGQCTVTPCDPGFDNCDQDSTNGCETPTVFDPMNCGKCANVCPMVENGMSSCSNGMCGLGSCDNGFSDCDGMLMNGCEANLAADVANCGMCGMVCKAPANAAPGCQMGQCGLGMCAPFFDNCDGRADNGCEKSVASDLANCGGCGKQCGTPNGTPACAKGVCSVASCNAGFADCDGDAATGCESKIDSDPKNCGKCANVCPAGGPNSMSLCDKGICSLSCAFGFLDCNNNPQDGCETNIATDPKNCGKCGNACPAQIANGKPVCDVGTCAASCDNGFGDCNNDLKDGCEKPVDADLANCGACGKACALANANNVCLAGKCGFASCKMGFADCNGVAADGCEASFDYDARNCSKCGMACPMNAPSCSMGACGAAVVYQQSFTVGVPAPAEVCNNWNAFRAALVGTYTSITISGTFDNMGASCAGMAADTLCQAIRVGNPTTLMCDNRTWHVGSCGNGIEVTADNTVCNCANPGFAIRPCIGNTNWGGAGTSTCNPPTQTIAIACK